MKKKRYMKEIRYMKEKREEIKQQKIEKLKERKE